jgi:hypothetical protein
MYSSAYSLALDGGEWSALRSGPLRKCLHVTNGTIGWLDSRIGVLPGKAS